VLPSVLIATLACRAVDVAAIEPVAVVRALVKTVGAVQHIYEINSRVPCELRMEAVGVLVGANPVRLSGPEGWKAQSYHSSGSWVVCWRPDPGSKLGAPLPLPAGGTTARFHVALPLSAPTGLLGWHVAFEGGIVASGDGLVECDWQRADSGSAPSEMLNAELDAAPAGTQGGT
jgi:hypothetical protein